MGFGNMTEQQPANLDPVRQERWDNWADSRICNIVDSAVEGLADEVGMVTGQQANKIFELLEIVQVLATGNDFLRGRIDQITREFKHQNGIEHKVTSRMTIATEEEHTSRVSKTVAIIDGILAE
jgi:hypothetical protein